MNDVLAINEHVTSGDVVKAGNQARQSCLARTRASNQSHPGPCANVEIDPVEDSAAQPAIQRRIGKRYVVELNSAASKRKWAAERMIRDRRLQVEEVENAFKRGKRGG